MRPCNGCGEAVDNSSLYCQNCNEVAAQQHSGTSAEQPPLKQTESTVPNDSFWETIFESVVSLPATSFGVLIFAGVSWGLSAIFGMTLIHAAAWSILISIAIVATVWIAVEFGMG